MRSPTFDYTTKSISGATPLEWIVLRMIQLGARISAAWGYRGFGTGCRALQKLVPARTLTIMLNKDTAFSTPFADSYWSVLLGGAEIYEPEIENFLKGLSGEKYTLVDCGANYGYWSALASGNSYGAQRVVAIEPSSDTFVILQNNAALNAARFTCIRKAVGAKAGVAQLSGSKHEARAIAKDNTAGENVEMLALDDLIDSGMISADERIVVKLDVEGLETAALAGSARLLAGHCIMICEEHGSDRNHTVSRYVLEKTDLKLFYYDPDSERFCSICNVAALDRVKRYRNRGYNVFATASPYWEKMLQCRASSASIPAKTKSGAALCASLAKGHFLTLL